MIADVRKVTLNHNLIYGLTPQFGHRLEKSEKISSEEGTRLREQFETKIGGPKAEDTVENMR